MRIPARPAIVLAVAAIALAGATAAWRAAVLQAQEQASTRFHYAVADMAQALRGRILDYEQVLRGAGGFLAYAGREAEESWLSYAASLELASVYPGIAAIGFAPWQANPPSARIRAIAPLGPRNRRALGFDMFSETERRKAMERARDTGEPVATGPLTLSQDRDEAAPPAFILYLPVYRAGAATASLDERRAALAGFVFGSFRMPQIAEGTVGTTHGIGWRLLDVTDAEHASLLFASEFPSVATRALYALAEPIVVRGRTWRLEARSLPSLEADVATDRPRIVLAGGLAVAVLLTILVWSLLNTRAHAVEMARGMVAAREELDRLRLAVDRHGDAMLMANARTTRVVYANEGASRLLGYGREELVGQPAALVFADRDADHLAKEYRGLAESGEDGSLELARFRRKDGTTFPVEISREYVPTENGGYVLGVARDISARLQAQEIIREGQQRLALALQNSGLALFDWDLRNGLVHLGKEWGALRGEEAVATVTPIQKLEQLVHPDDLPALQEKVRALVHGEVPEYRLEHRVRCVDGQWKWIESIAKVSERDASGRALRITGTNADVSERRALAELKNLFVANVSHELRTPLTGIIASIELMREGALGELPAQAKKFLEIAHGNAERLSELINDLLDLERVESGRMHLELQRVGVRSVLEEAVQVNASYVARYKAHAVIDADDGLEVTADRKRLLQILTNLVANAARYSPAEGAITLAARAAGERVVLSVSDEGAGVPPEFVPRLFGKFEQAERSKGGTGLGLALSKSMTEKMGGRMSYQPVPSGGACFLVELPAAV